MPEEMSIKYRALVIIDVELSYGKEMKKDFNNENIKVLMTSDTTADTQTAYDKALKTTTDEVTPMIC